MSLVGNLEDLSLGDIMQIISLSQKTGVLILRSSAYGSGRIVFRAGLVCAACLDGRSEPAEDDAALEAEVEAIVLHMFSWRSGDFSFDLRSEPEPEDPGFELTTGLNAQYLAMEGMRVQDEASRGHAAGAVEPSAPTTETSVAETSSAESALAEPEAAKEAPVPAEPPVVASPEPVTEELTFESEPAPQAEEDPFADWTFGGDGEKPGQEVIQEFTSELTQEVTEEAAEPKKEEPPAATKVLRSRPLILIDADAVFVGWAKEALRVVFQQVHVFQQADQGLARIRQYLIRGEFPIVLISSQIEIDPLCGIQGVTDFVRRLKTQAPRLPIYRLTEEASAGEPASSRPVGAFDGDLARPARECIQEWAKNNDSEAYTNLIDPLLAQLDAVSESDRSL